MVVKEPALKSAIQITMLILIGVASLQQAAPAPQFHISEMTVLENVLKVYFELN